METLQFSFVAGFDSLLQAPSPAKQKKPLFMGSKYEKEIKLLGSLCPATHTREERRILSTR